jgi:hypothetical protein
MSRKLKVAADKQVLYNGKHYFAGDTFSAPDNDPEVDRHIERGDTSSPPPRVGETRRRPTSASAQRTTTSHSNAAFIHKGLKAADSHDRRLKSS